MIVVLDTSVWVSALEFGGIPELAVKQASLSIALQFQTIFWTR